MKQDREAIHKIMNKHSYRSESGCQICTKCGTAKHKKLYKDFKFWLGGQGYDVEPDCIEAMKSLTEV